MYRIIKKFSMVLLYLLVQMDIINKVFDLIPKSPHDLGHKVDTCDMSVVFLSVHYLLVALSIRAQTGAIDYARNHPFPSWFVCITSCFGGKVIQNALLGKPIVEIYLNLTNVALASIVWYLVFFAPKDIIAELSSVKAVKAVMFVLKEVHRLRGIKDGVKIASSIYSGNWFVAILIGCVRGSGAKFLGRPLHQFIQGSLCGDNEFLKPAFSTKHSVVSAALIWLQMSGHIDIDMKLLICLLYVVAVSVQLLILLSKIDDPYKKVEDICCKVTLELPNELAKKNGKKKAE